MSWWNKILSWFKSAPKPPTLAVGKTVAGYGRVNRWAASEKTLKKDIEACAKHGVKIYHIELMGWANSPDWKSKVESAYKLAVELCRENGLWLFVSFANSNKGSGKYGDDRIPLSAMPDAIAWYKSIVLKNGKKNVLLQPMAETGGSYNAKLEASLSAEFSKAGFALVYNGGSRPNAKPGWAAWNAWHPFKVSDKTPGNQIIVSDTGMIIQQLCEGLEGKGKPAAAKAWAQKIKATGAPAVVFYHFKYAAHDSATIKAMGESVK